MSLKESLAQRLHAVEKPGLKRQKLCIFLGILKVYFNVRLEDNRSCILVIMGQTRTEIRNLWQFVMDLGKASLAFREMLLDLKQRGLSFAPKLAIGDGSLGFWAALAEVFGQTKIQRCWVHKTVILLDKMPKRIQSKVRSMIYEMYMAATKEDVLKAYNYFIQSFEPKYPKAVECLRKDRQDLFTFYDFPANHWIHIRTTNPIESTFATLRLRTTKTKGCGSRIATLSMVFKLTMEAAKTWKKLKGHQLILLILENKKFVNVELAEEVAA